MRFNHSSSTEEWRQFLHDSAQRTWGDQRLPALEVMLARTAAALYRVMAYPLASEEELFTLDPQPHALFDLNQDVQEA
jgi:hypothetical protein